MSIDIAASTLVPVVVAVGLLAWYAHRVRKSYMDSLDAEDE